MSKLWYTSDTHFFHQKIIEYCDRPFVNSEEMDEALIANWNKVVKPEDHIWHLGDVVVLDKKRDEEKFIALCKRLHGHKRLILGNHDKFRLEVYGAAGFEKVRSSHRHDRILFTHVPIHPASLGMTLACVHGHIHNNHPDSFPPVKAVDFDTGEERMVPYINISVEETGYAPVDMEWILARIPKKQMELPLEKEPELCESQT